MDCAELRVLVASALQWWKGWVEERRPPPGSAQIQNHTMMQAESTATAAIRNEAELNGLPGLEHPAPPLERRLQPLLLKLSQRRRSDMVDSQRTHSFTGVST